MEYYSAVKKNRIMPFVTTRMDPELIKQSEVNQRKNKCHDTAHTWSLKWGTSQPIYKTETNAQVWRTGLRLPSGQHGLGVWD